MSETELEQLCRNLAEDLSLWLEIISKYNLVDYETKLQKSINLVGRANIMLNEYNEIKKVVEEKWDDPCPECGTQLIAQISGGVKCPSCGYWFCY